MLLNDLYRIENSTLAGNSIQTSVLLNPQHAIFKGHFPQTPVLPGVCQIQLCTEILNAVLQKNYQITNVLSVKFLSFVNPEENADLAVQLDFSEAENGLSLNASIHKENVIFLKLKAILKS